jgi:predicted CoA-substrate-specific enzyme activase
MKMNTFLGLDIGSVNVKACLITHRGELLKKETSRVTSDAIAAVNSAVIKLGNLEGVLGIGVSGSGRSVIPAHFGTGEFTSPLAIASGLLHYYPDARTIIQLGGHSSLIIRLEDGLKKPWKVVSNPLCAAGTGRFLEQQAYRLGISLDDFSRLALDHQGVVPRIAARCSVFAKSDLIHLQQKGVALPAMLYALCESVARMVSSLNGGTFDEPVYLVGGMSANPAIVQALKEAVSERNGHSVEVTVPDEAFFIEALGGALLSRNCKSHLVFPLQQVLDRNNFQSPSLTEVARRDRKTDATIKSPITGYLGVDIGSTSTKAVILDEAGKIVIAKNYIMTSGKPVDAVRQMFRNLLDKGAGMVNIAGVGVTGSGRYLVGHFIGADLVKNEITAQTRGAAEIDPEADIIEIGGQDSKLVIKRRGVVVDYQMNKACAAGTGSFIDELAEALGVKVTNGDFARLAFKAPHTIDLGTRCAAFMGQSVALAQQEGVPLEVIAASLAGSIAKNYLSKVVGHRKLGDKIVLTGAVFYNDAVVSAFREQLGDKQVTVAEHCEVSGAIGAALLARENKGDQPSTFKGFERVSNLDCDLNTFVCQVCDNNCTITKMSFNGNEASYYGSRCDRYDSRNGIKKQHTFFDEREKLLFSEYREGNGRGPTVGVPRALLTYDLAPLLIGFLNALHTRVILSGKTTGRIMEKSAELSYSDSCFPLKIMHGHVDSLKDTAQYIFYPSAIRLGAKEGDENQKYTCPLVQAAPFIVREVLGLGKRIVAPVLDFSLGNDEVIRNLTGAAVEMGFSRHAGRSAALAGIAVQNKFHFEKDELSDRLIKEVRIGQKPGVVILSRSYMSQDSGANMGIAETLANLGVIPIPMDFLPLNSVNPGEYSDRPYWSYEGKLISAAAIIAKEPNLYGLVLTNFGCGPNSFILPLLEDIMGGKPMGQLEIDEHAAEAGLVTRLEAFVDTIASYASTRNYENLLPVVIRRSSASITAVDKLFVIPRMAPFIDVAGAVMEAAGCSVLILPEPNEQNLRLANRVTSGTECLPYRVTLGDYLRFFQNNNQSSRDVQLLMAGSYGPCRLGKYALEQDKVLRSLGYDARVHTTVSNNAYRDINVGPDLLRYGMSAIFAVDWLERLLWRTRPYEKEHGVSERIFDDCLRKMVSACRSKQVLRPVLKNAAEAFYAARDDSIPRKPLVGINGEIYLRTNAFSNRDLVKECEAAGLEVMVSPMSEWIKYTSYRNLEDNIRFRRLRKIPASFIKHHILKGDDERLFALVKSALGDRAEPSIEDILLKTRHYLSPRCGSEAVLSIGAGLEWMENPDFAGVISVMPHGCMPGGIVAAMAEKFARDHRKPWISLTYDGIMETNNQTRISNFAEVIRYCSKPCG